MSSRRESTERFSPHSVREHHAGPDELSLGDKRRMQLVQRRATSGAAPARQASPTVADLGASRPLDAGTRDRMGQAFGHDFGGVQVHTEGGAANHVARSGVDAMTIGEHVAFGAGQYRPGTEQGDRLIAHELGHTLQQRGALAPETPLGELGRGGDHAEADADRMADEAGHRAGGESSARKAIAPTVSEGPKARGGNMGGCFSGGKDDKEPKGNDAGGDATRMSLAEAKRRADAICLALNQALTEAEVDSRESASDGGTEVNAQMWAFTGSFALLMWAEAEGLEDTMGRDVGDIDVFIASLTNVYNAVEGVLGIDGEETFEKDVEGKHDGAFGEGDDAIDIDLTHGDKFGNIEGRREVRSGDKTYPLLACEMLLVGYENVLAELEKSKPTNEKDVAKKQRDLVKTQRDIEIAKAILERRKARQAKGGPTCDTPKHEGPKGPPKDPDPGAGIVGY